MLLFALTYFSILKTLMKVENDGKRYVYNLSIICKGQRIKLISSLDNTSVVDKKACKAIVYYTRSQECIMFTINQAFINLQFFVLSCDCCSIEHLAINKISMENDGAICRMFCLVLQFNGNFVMETCRFLGWHCCNFSTRC